MYYLYKRHLRSIRRKNTRHFIKLLRASAPTPKLKISRTRSNSLSSRSSFSSRTSSNTSGLSRTPSFTSFSQAGPTSFSAANSQSHNVISPMDEVNILPVNSQVPTVMTKVESTPASSVGLKECVDYFLEKVGGKGGTDDIDGFRYAGEIYLDFQTEDHGSLLYIVASLGYDEILGNMLELGAEPEMGKPVSSSSCLVPRQSQY
jgi:hypothetical protein